MPRRGMSASRYASSCRTIAARSSGGHESLAQRPRFQVSRHLRWSARETNLRICAVRVTIAPETRLRLSPLAQRLARSEVSALLPQLSRDADSTQHPEQPRQLIPVAIGGAGSIGFNESVREALIAAEVAVSSEAKLFRGEMKGTMGAAIVSTDDRRTQP